MHAETNGGAALAKNTMSAALRGLARRVTGAGLGLAIVLSAAIPGLGQAQDTPLFETPPQTRQVSGMVMIDYTQLELANGGNFDLFGVHYLQQMNDWLYFGTGAIAPMVEGNYSGFFAADATLHAQGQISGNWFWNAGIAAGAGAGGDSMVGITQLSGEGLFARAYAGVGYQFRNFSFGVNYARVAILGSPINDSNFNLFVQRPLSFSVGRYADHGRTVAADSFDAPQHENILSLETNLFSQISPQGNYTGDVGVVSSQFTHFLNRDYYTFFAVDIGYYGMPWYNQAHGGFGRRFRLSEHVSLYTQLGVGSGGWITDAIDMGPGFIIYPKATLEYLWGNGVGTTVSAGYLYAPMGTSRNWTFGLGFNYHLSHPERAEGEDRSGDLYTMRGFRLNIMDRATGPIFYNRRETEGLNMIAVQLDYALNDRWYVAGHIAAATEAFRGFAGYAEGYFGLGWQSRAFLNGRLQAYAQLMYGLNDVGGDAAHDVGTLLYPSFGLTYALNERVALYGQVGRTISLGQYTSGLTNRFENTSIGLGVSYRFSLPTRS